MSRPVDIPDPQLAAAVASALGEGPPFTLGALQAFDGALRVRGARDLTGLGALESLGSLHLVCCVAPPGGALAGTRGLRELQVEATPLIDVRGLTSSLRRVELRFTRVEDPSPILGLELEHLELTGCPITEEWWDSHLGEVVVGPVARTVVVPPPHHRSTNGRLAAHGFGVTMGFDTDDRAWLVHPGPDAVALCATNLLLQDSILFALDEGHVAGRSYIDDLVAYNETGPVPYDPTAMTLPYEVAGADGARSWVQQAATAGKDAIGLQLFLHAFRGLGFHRFPDGAPPLSPLARGWTPLLHVLAGTVPDVYVEHCLDGGQLNPQAYLYDGRWWHVRRMCVSDDQLRAALADEGLLPVAEDERARTILYVREDDPGGTVYLLSLEDPVSSPSASGVPAYPSLAGVLAATRSLRLPDGTVIEAQD